MLGCAKRLGLKMEHKGLSIEDRIPELSLGRVEVVSAAHLTSFARLERKRASAVKSVWILLYGCRVPSQWTAFDQTI